MSEYPILDLSSIPSLVSSVSSHSFFAQITPDIAKSIITKHNYDRQRPLTRNKVATLKSAMEDKTFISVSPIIFTIENNDCIMIDGQHRLAAMIESNTKWILPIVISKEKADYLYPKIDRGKTRSLKDAVRSSQISLSMNLSETATLRVAVGVKLILNGYTLAPRLSYATNRISEDKLLSVVLNDYKKEAIRVYEMVDHLEYGKKITGRIPMSILLSLYKYIPENKIHKVDEFIYGCASNIGLAEGDTRRLIYTMYATSSRMGGRNVYRLAMTREYELGNILTCWKYWYDGRPYTRKFSENQIRKTLSMSPNLQGTSITFHGRSGEI